MKVPEGISSYSARSSLQLVQPAAQLAQLRPVAFRRTPRGAGLDDVGSDLSVPRGIPFCFFQGLEG
eukprot:7052780-Pyramimonas_sp.AAC.1